MKEFKDRVAVVTGAASGIGYSMVERFAQEGMKVVLADIEETALNKAVATLKEQGVAAMGMVVDVSKPKDIEDLAQKTLTTFGSVDILCNNAGVSGDIALSWRQPIESWQWVLGVNLWSVIYGLQTFVPIMLAQNTEGHIINTASMAGLLSLPMGSVYHATKHAVVTVSESLYYELQMLGAKIKVSVLCPGFVKTKIGESARNRPTQLEHKQEVLAVEEMWTKAVMGLIEHGTSATDLANQVMAAIQNERSYILTHPDLIPSVRKRAENIATGTNPTLDLPSNIEMP